MGNVMLYVVAVLTWGSTWIAINLQLGTVAPEISVIYRYSLAVIILFAWCSWRGLSLRFSWRAHGVFFLLGVFLFSFNYIGTYSAQQYISSALNAVTFSTMMWMNVINSRIFFKTQIEPRVYVGAALGMVGIIILFWPEIREVSWSDSTIIGMSFCLGAAAMASFGNMVSQRAQRQQLPVLQANAWGMLYGTLITTAVALGRGHEFALDPSPQYWLALVYLAIFGTVVAFTVYLKLLGRIGAHKAGYVVVMFPVVAFTLSYIFEDLSITPTLLMGVGLILLGNVVVLGGFEKLTRRWRYKRLPTPVVANS
ncbi:MAG: EamA family transporter [Xanthomonadales bacterium]|nr:EamA family transporter [Xanthomonadales bacterium]